MKKYIIHIHHQNPRNKFVHAWSFAGDYKLKDSGVHPFGAIHKWVSRKSANTANLQAKATRLCSESSTNWAWAQERTTGFWKSPEPSPIWTALNISQHRIYPRQLAIERSIKDLSGLAINLGLSHLLFLGLCPGPRQRAFCSSQYQIRFVSRTYRCFNLRIWFALCALNSHHSPDGAHFGPFGFRNHFCFCLYFTIP